MIAITGMHRSGTSCVTGLLVKCGLSLGTRYPLMNVPARDNAKGHFENLGALAINDTILRYAGGNWAQPPSPSAIEQVGSRFAPHFEKFSTTFDGDLFKDPRTCLTMSLWERHCPNLDAVVLCVRNPIGVAGSLKRRNRLPVEIGVKLWYEYNLRVIEGAKGLPVFVVDYDNLGRDLEFELSSLLSELGVDLDAGAMRERVAGFYSAELNHDISRKLHLDLLPEDARRLYEIILSQSYARRFEQKTAVA
ncbi:MAG: hypothetical protein GF418_13785 [Chitinivibrionales bacterium]|nr:hypothetical protein [Chitinivibrionales bacterium]MBD3396692.1 hypothetical protein [Chitinivibrionales bacterium]